MSYVAKTKGSNMSQWVVLHTFRGLNLFFKNPDGADLFMFVMPCDCPAKFIQTNKPAKGEPAMVN